ncbi:hypothetical protein K469DRAFT_696110 [Zopfia rhizophila CBS 207.26]|uniref:Uncharacterized protein n=1 Tax=Zopfia rhizophila CBS 207.26 TaxID=1314779 RepID=A0A6A6EKB2_9PEZI|nr:hypothetical protein K469DRAFT_696110 [Zopfia rhizophila CBS 207.26]
MEALFVKLESMRTEMQDVTFDVKIACGPANFDSSTFASEKRKHYGHTDCSEVSAHPFDYFEPIKALNMVTRMRKHRLRSEARLRRAVWNRPPFAISLAICQLAAISARFVLLRARNGLRGEALREGGRLRSAGNGKDSIIARLPVELWKGLSIEDITSPGTEEILKTDDDHCSICLFKFGSSGREEDEIEEAVKTRQELCGLVEMFPKMIQPTVKRYLAVLKEVAYLDDQVDEHMQENALSERTTSVEFGKLVYEVDRLRRLHGQVYSDITEALDST